MTTNNELFQLKIEPRGRRTTRFAFLARPDKSKEFVRYEAEGVTGVVFVHRKAMADMRRIALTAVPNETIGILYGRPCTDEQGDYTLVMGVERARPGEYVGTPGSVRISAAGRAAVKARAAQNYPGFEEIGWFHTHPFGEPRFSRTDFEEQETLLNHQVGIVAAAERYRADRGDPLGIYLGQRGHRLAAVEPEPGRQLPPAPEPEGQADPRRPYAPEMLSRLWEDARSRAAIILAVLVATQLGAAMWIRSAVQAPRDPAAATAVAPRLRTATQPPRLVRLVPGLVTERTCSAGTYPQYGLQLPKGFSDPLAATVVNKAVANVGYAPVRRELIVDCIAPGTTTIELRDTINGAKAAIELAVIAQAKAVRP